MGLYDIFSVSGSAMSAQTVRLNTTASNIANADSVASSSGEAYKARHPVFSTVLKNVGQADQVSAGVKVVGIVESSAAPIARYEPNNPLADEGGYVYAPNISLVEEMANMISASRSYQSNVQVANMTKNLISRTLTLGQ
ncbi:MAG: flagellar basal body rod protein FlgC [Kangiella sp.]|nr:MAG: flagellar basal body rod protein FlgC [Kangiella sp.]